MFSLAQHANKENSMPSIYYSMCSLNCICNQVAHTRPQKKARNDHEETFHCPCCHVGSSKIFIHACTGQRHGRRRRAEPCCCSGGMRWTSLICVCSSPTPSRR